MSTYKIFHGQCKSCEIPVLKHELIMLAEYCTLQKDEKHVWYCDKCRKKNKQQVFDLMDLLKEEQKLTAK